MNPFYIIGFSGHRSVSSPVEVSAALLYAFNLVMTRVKERDGIAALYTSAAAGGDQLALGTAESLGLSAHIVVPFSEEEFKHDFAPDQWADAARYITKARHREDGWSLRHLESSTGRPDAYYDAGIQVVDACDVLVAVWDGLPARGVGGTGDMVEYALRSNKPVITIAPGTGEMALHEGWQSPPKPAADIRIPQGASEQLLDDLAEALQGEGLQANADTASIHDALDTLANNKRNEFRQALIGSIWLHGTATFIAALSATLPKNEAWSYWALAGMSGIELLLVIKAWSLVHKVHHTGSHKDGLLSRTAAELVRGIRISVPFVDPLSPLILSHSPVWRRFALSISLTALREPHIRASWQARMQLYIRERLADQARYFRGKQLPASLNTTRTAHIAKWATRLAPIVVGSALLYKGFHAVIGADAPPFSLKGLGLDLLFVFMPIAVPLAAGFFTSLRIAKDSMRRHLRYAGMASRLEAVSAQLSQMKTESAAGRMIRANEEVLIDELIEWELAERQNEGH